MADNEWHFVSHFQILIHLIKSIVEQNEWKAGNVLTRLQIRWNIFMSLADQILGFSRRAVDRKCTVAWQTDPFRQEFQNISSRFPTERKELAVEIVSFSAKYKNKRVPQAVIYWSAGSSNNWRPA